MSEDRPRGVVFHHHRGWLCLLLTNIVVFTTVYFVVMLTVPAFRDDLLATTPIVFTVLVGLTVFAYASLVYRLWRSAWTFEVTDLGLIAVHQFTRARHEIPWTSIEAVRRKRPAPLSYFAARQFTGIVVSDGTELLFSQHLSNYDEFLDELRLRMAGRPFDPHS